MSPWTGQKFQQEFSERLWKSRDWTVVIEVTGLSSVAPESSEAVLATFLVDSVMLSASGPVLLKGKFRDLFKLEGRVALPAILMYMSPLRMVIMSHHLHLYSSDAAAAYHAACQAAGGDPLSVEASVLRLKLRGNVLGPFDALV